MTGKTVRNGIRADGVKYGGQGYFLSHCHVWR